MAWREYHEGMNADSANDVANAAPAPGNPGSSEPLSFDYAQELDLADPLQEHRDAFIGSDDPALVAYLDGNSLGRPLQASADRIGSFITEQWGSRLIRGWDEGWLTLPARIGDDLGAVMLGAAPGQITIGDSTTVLLYKLCRAAVAARPDRREIVLDTENFPTDRFVLQGIAAECGLELRWITPAYEGGVTAAELEAAVGSTPRSCCSAMSPTAPDTSPTFRR